MPPSLGIFDKAKEPKSFGEVQHLTAKEYADYKEAAETLRRLPNDQDRFQSILTAFVEFMDVVMDHEEILDEPSYINGPLLKRELNTKLSNYLSAIRSFLDQSDKALSDRYGRTSNQRVAFKNAINEVYDNSFSYRLLEQARNYTQHAGEAISRVSYGWQAVEESTEPASESYLVIAFDRNRFLEWEKLKKSFRKELEEQPESIPVTTHVQQVAGCVEYLNNVFIMQQINELVNAANHIVSLTAPLKELQGVPCIMNFDVPRLEVGESGKFNLNTEWIPIDLAQFVLEAHAHNSGLSTETSQE